MRLAAASATFRVSYTAFGLVPGNGGTYYLPRIVGEAKALELFWAAEPISATEALEIGLVNQVQGLRTISCQHLLLKLLRIRVLECPVEHVLHRAALRISWLGPRSYSSTPRRLITLGVCSRTTSDPGSSGGSFLISGLRDDVIDAERDCLTVRRGSRRAQRVWGRKYSVAASRPDQKQQHWQYECSERQDRHVFRPAETEGRQLRQSVAL